MGSREGLERAKIEFMELYNKTFHRFAHVINIMRVRGEDLKIVETQNILLPSIMVKIQSIYFVVYILRMQWIQYLPVHWNRYMSMQIPELLAAKI